MIARQSNMEHKKRLAKDIAGVGQAVEPLEDKVLKPTAVKK
jgi:hypothetical protein